MASLTLARPATCAPHARSSTSRALSATAPRAVSRRVACSAAVQHPNGRCTVEIVPEEEAVGPRLCEVVVDAVKAAIAERGSCAMAIPGGHMLTMLPGLIGVEGIDWSKVYLFYVNHKCVPSDSSASTHKKSADGFLTELGLTNAYPPSGSDDAAAEAAAYVDAMKALGPEILPVNDEGLPVFDLMLIGLGGDGHIGSLYPNKPEVLIGADGPWCLPVVKDTPPPSITLSLPVINAGKQKVFASIGRNMKTGGTKSECTAIAIEGTEGAAAFPAQGVTDCLWILDPLAASELKQMP